MKNLLRYQVVITLGGNAVLDGKMSAVMAYDIISNMIGSYAPDKGHSHKNLVLQDMVDAKRTDVFEDNYLAVGGKRLGYVATCIRDIELSPEELAAIKEFAKTYGREWKEYLMAAWLSYSYKGLHMGGKDSGILRAIRNTRGHTWLANFKLPKD